MPGPLPKRGGIIASGRAEARERAEFKTGLLPKRGGIVAQPEFMLCRVFCPSAACGRSPSFGPGGRLRPIRRPPGPVRRPPGPVRRPPGPVRRPPGKKGGLPLCCRLVKGVPGLRVLGSLGGSCLGFPLRGLNYAWFEGLRGLEKGGGPRRL